MVQAGTLFEYLAAFITVVLGLAMADLLVSFHRLLQARHRVKWRTLPLLLAVFVFLVLLTGFFELWIMTRWDRLGYYGLVWQMCLYVPIFLSACAVLPDEVPAEGLDLGDFYAKQRPYIAVLLIVMLLLDMADETVGLLTRGGLDRLAQPSFLTFYVPLNLAALATFAVIGWSRRSWLHWAGFALLFAVSHMGFSTWAIRGAPAAVAEPAALP